MADGTCCIPQRDSVVVQGETAIPSPDATTAPEQQVGAIDAGLKSANLYFAQLLRTMQASSATQATKPLQQGSPARIEEKMRPDDEGELRLQDPHVFDPDLAKRLFRQRWKTAMADVDSGAGRRHASVVQ